MALVILDSGHVINADCSKEFLERQFNDKEVVLVTIYGRLVDEDITNMRKISFNKNRVLMVE